jgi:hypothetical protein
MRFPLPIFDRVYAIGAAGFWFKRLAAPELRCSDADYEIEAYVIERERVNDSPELFA